MLICKLCNKQFQQITDRHLQIKHNYSCKEYLLQFPGELLVDPEVTKRKSEAVSKAKKGTIPWNKGVPATEEQKLKQSEIMKQKYDSDYIHWNTGNKLSNETKDKISNSLLGHKFFDKNAIEKRNETIANKVKNGWISPLKYSTISEIHKQKISDTLSNKIQLKSIKAFERINDICSNNDLIIKSISSNYYLELECLKCNTIFNNTRQVFNLSKNNGEKLCPHCYPKDKIVSNMEIELRNLIQSISPNINLIFNDRKILEGKEIDILIPDHAIGIEFAGLYWHSSNEIDKLDYHILHKQQFAYKKNIKLITIFENEWMYKKDIIYSRLNNLLGKSEKIFARKCEIKEISHNESKIFLVNNHIQGNCNSSIRYGLFYNNELSAVMTFGKSRFDKNIEYELLRYCNKLNTTVVGGASKLFKHFVGIHDPLSVVSYSDKRWNTGSLYKKLQFNYISTTIPNYYYVKPNDLCLYSRHEFQKHKLKYKLKNYNEHNSEKQNMIDNGYRILYDCGMTKWIWLVSII